MKNLFLLPAYCLFSFEHLCCKVFVWPVKGRCIKWFLMLFLTSTSGLGQSQIKGLVQGDENKPLSFATVLLLSAKDSSLIKGAITTEAGEYEINHVQAGSYQIAVSMMGYQKVYSASFAVLADSRNVTVPLLITSSQTQQLGQVTVIAQKPLFEQQLDRLVVNVQSSIIAAGATALDVLERSPGVAVNRQNQTLTMLGKAGVMIMVNGKVTRLPAEALIQMLAGMNAGNIEKIELIPTPPAGFDAEGTGGIINIVLKKNQAYGMNGNYSLTMGYGWYERPGATLNINQRTRKLNFFTDGSFLWDHYWFSTYTNRRFLNQQQMVESSNLSNRNTYHMSYNARMGFEYSLGMNTSLNGMVAGFNNRQEQFSLNEAKIYQADALQTTIDVKDHEINQWQHLMGNLNLQHSFKDQSKLSVDLDYLLYHHNNPHWYENNFWYWQENAQSLEFMNNTKFTPIHIGVGKVDYHRKFSDKTELETGLKATLSYLHNDVHMEKLIGERWLTDPEFSQQVHMREEISAAYANVKQQVNEHTKVQVGLRWEYTHTDLAKTTGENLLKRRYHYLFPSVFISRDLTTNHTVQLSYSRRITRPTYKDLSPAFTFVDPYTSLHGNTSLLPAITDAIQGVYQWKKKYSLTLQYSYDKNALAWLMRLDAGQNKQYTYMDNIKGVSTYSLNVSIPVTLTPWWHMQNNLMGTWQQNQTSYQGENLRIAGYSGQINSTHTFTLPKNFSIELSGLYKSRSYMGILQFRPYGYVNIGLQKKFNGEGGTLRLTVTDLFWNMRYEVVNNLPALNLYQNLGFRYEPRVLRLTYSRSFGNKQVKVLNNRSTGSEEERRRVGN